MAPWLIGVGKWIARLIGGWLPIGDKPISEWLGKILWVVGIIMAVLFLWNKLSAPTGSIKTGAQKAEDICNVYHSQVLRPALFGCASLKVMEYYKDTARSEHGK